MPCKKNCEFNVQQVAAREREILNASLHHCVTSVWAAKILFNKRAHLFLLIPVS